MKPIKARIILVDDDPLVHELVKAVLGDNYELEYVDNSEDAWEGIFFSGTPFDLIILDIMMPKTDGIEFLKRIRQVNPWLPVLLITGHGTYQRLKEAVDLKINGYMEKPVYREALLKKINEIIGITNNNGVKTGLQYSLKQSGEKILHPVIKECMEKIHRWFHTAITVDTLARSCALSKTHLSRIFKNDCGMTIKNYINCVKIAAAKRLLKDSGFTVSIIRESLGYKSRTHFFNFFKRNTGMSPMAFRRMYKK
ncbi:MAG: response regulator [Nitrospinae bacterium]|nr:response regulator [Nitrospinota bacterium]